MLLKEEKIEKLSLSPVSTIWILTFEYVTSKAILSSWVKISQFLGNIVAHPCGTDILNNQSWNDLYGKSCF